MEGVEFEQDQFNYRYNNLMMERVKKNSLADWLVKKGIVSSERQANAMLLVLAVVALLISIFLFSRSFKGVPEAVIDLPPQIMNRLPENIQKSLTQPR